MGSAAIGGSSLSLEPAFSLVMMAEDCPFFAAPWGEMVLRLSLLRAFD